MTEASVAIVIPARAGSTRFPGKPMAPVAGKAMLERVWSLAKGLRASSYIIATDDEALAEFARGFGAQVVMTSESCRSGTDRSAEAVLGLAEQPDIVVNLQGDSPLTPPWVISACIEEMRANPEAQIVTPALPLVGEDLKNFIASKEAGSTTGTTVVVDSSMRALYFSKKLLPFFRSGAPKDGEVLRHIGLYVYRYQTLMNISRMEQGFLEQCEHLEQLRALEAGIPINVVRADYRGRTHASIDNPEDVAVVEALIAKEGELDV